jgi:hypothetical protein
MSRKLYFGILIVLTLSYLIVEFFRLIDSVYSLTMLLVLAEITVLVRRKSLGLPLYPLTPKQFKKDFTKRFFNKE